MVLLCLALLCVSSCSSKSPGGKGINGVSESQEKGTIKEDSQTVDLPSPQSNDEYFKAMKTCLIPDTHHENKSVNLKFSIDDEVYLYGLDNAEDLPESRGDPYLNILLLPFNDSYLKFSLGSIYEDDFSYEGIKDSAILFSDYLSDVGGVKLYLLNLPKDQLFYSDNLTEQENANFLDDWIWNMRDGTTTIILSGKEILLQEQQLEICR